MLCCVVWNRFFLSCFLFIIRNVYWNNMRTWKNYSLQVSTRPSVRPCVCVSGGSGGGSGDSGHTPLSLKPPPHPGREGNRDEWSAYYYYVYLVPSFHISRITRYTSHTTHFIFSPHHTASLHSPSHITQAFHPISPHTTFVYSLHSALCLVLFCLVLVLVVFDLPVVLNCELRFDFWFSVGFLLGHCHVSCGSFLTHLQLWYNYVW